MRRLLTFAFVALLAGSACAAAPPATPQPTATPLSSTPPQAPATQPPASAGPSPPSSPSPSGLAGLLQEIRAERERAPLGAVDPASLASVAAADATLGFELYRLLAGDGGNLFLSPYSISTALSMTYAGARAETELELARLLSVPDDIDWHAARNELELRLIAERRAPEGMTPLTLEPTNAVFGQQGFPFEVAYLDTLAAYYGGGMQLVDFIGQTEGSRAAVNEWVSQRTRERIRELLPPGSVTPLTRFVLLNAIYFKANWLNEFDPSRTAERAFHLLDGSVAQVPTMQGGLRTGYGSGDGWQAVSLPYAGQASMLVIVPDMGGFAGVEARLDYELLDSVRASLGDTIVNLELPRWESSSTIDLQPLLVELGVTTLFVPGEADLSGIAPPDDLHVTDALHQANITVDEEGTEAAAATAIVGGVTSAPPREVSLKVDRPFIYLIQDDLTGEILFMGRVLDPSAG
ncbi:MAG TPA: serpin family protein [Candidatus Limnocylindria bacterium]|nr:serpin family protein [Candidatus Limnocylindria bacterium]